MEGNAEVFRVQSKVQEVYMEHFIRAMFFFKTTNPIQVLEHITHNKT